MQILEMKKAADLLVEASELLARSGQEHLAAEASLHKSVLLYFAAFNRQQPLPRPAISNRLGPPL
jgi:hypothetical protein